jgi:membrane protease YdiL (CAAX protease family)
MNKVIRGIADVAWYLVLYILLQLIISAVFMAVAEYALGVKPDNTQNVIIISVLSNLLAVLLFVKYHYTPVSPTYLHSGPWGVMFWTAMAALGSILPLEWLYEKINIEMPESMEQMFEGVMGEPMGYLAIGIFAPLAEEVVMRGAVLRKLLEIFQGFDENKYAVAKPSETKWGYIERQALHHWLPIVISALLFAAIHGNIAQGAHALLLGLLLGWLYYRTGSILPGVVLHWVNNTVAYVMFNLMPQMHDGKLIDLFHGDAKMMAGGIVFSLMILAPSIYQLALRAKRAEE